MALYQTGGSAKSLQQQKRRSSSCQVGEWVRGYSEELNVPKQFETHEATVIATIAKERIISSFKRDGKKKLGNYKADSKILDQVIKQST